MNFFQKCISNEILFLSKFFNNVYFSHSPSYCNKINNLELFNFKYMNFTEGSLIVLDGNINFSNNFVEELSLIREKCNPKDRIILIAYNSYFNWIYRILSIIGVRSKKSPPNNTISKATLSSIVEISNFEITKSKPLVFFPFSIMYLGNILNSIMGMFPILSNLSICHIYTLRPKQFKNRLHSLSVIIPLRNESKNINTIFRDLRLLADIDAEFIFVEGNSTDDTWEQLNTISKSYEEQYRFQISKQPGKGKNNAVTHGINISKSELIVILDADLTVDVKNVIIFYNIICSGKADLVNGNRLFYPFENGAMRFLNWLGNLFFAKLVSYIFQHNISDTLCGTKIFFKNDYNRFIKWNEHLKIDDPFGDFKLLFPALDLGVGICDVPVYYRSRKYGETNISRFRDGFLLLNICMKCLIKRKLL